MRRHSVWMTALILTMVMAVACGRKKAPIARPVAPPPAPSAADTVPGRPPSPPEPVRDAAIVPPEPVRDDAVSSASLDDLNRSSPLRPVFFDLDSSDLSSEGQRVLDGNAAVLKQHGTWTITIEG